MNFVCIYLNKHIVCILKCGQQASHKLTELMKYDFKFNSQKYIFYFFFWI